MQDGRSLDVQGTWQTWRRHEVVKPLGRNRQTNINGIDSPYAGGIPTEYVESVGAGACGGGAGYAVAALKVATLNPGRTGFVALGTQSLLDWRIQAVATALLERNIDLCVLPGARFPPEAVLPPGFPYVWLGTQSLDYNAVGLFLRPELEAAVQIIEDFTLPRVMWLVISSGCGGSASPSPQLLVCAFYAAPGGDVATWQKIITDAALLGRRYPLAQLLLAGDDNIHLSYIFQHHTQCVCLHCKQSQTDRQIEDELQSVEILACNPPVPTHVSGTCIELIGSLRSTLVPVEVVTSRIGLSDHFMPVCSVIISVQARPQLAFGRVAWKTNDAWEAALGAVEGLLHALAD